MLKNSLSLLIVLLLVGAQNEASSQDTFGRTDSFSPLPVVQDSSPLPALQPSFVPKDFGNQSIYQLRPQSELHVLRDASPLPALNPKAFIKPSTSSSSISPLRTSGGLEATSKNSKNASSTLQSWTRLLKRFERFNTAEAWKQRFSIPASLKSNRLSHGDAIKTLGLMRRIDSDKRFAFVSGLKEYRDLRQRLEREVRLAATPTK